MTKTIETTVLKPHMAPHGQIVQAGEPITIDETRYRALLKRGYVARVGDDTAADDDDAEGEKQPKAGLTNADIKPRRQKIVGEEKS